VWKYQRDVRSDLQALDVIRLTISPFTFGFVPMYVEPQERTEFRMADKPDVLTSLKNMAGGGVPVLHGLPTNTAGSPPTTMNSGNDLSDRPVRGDSEAFVTHRLVGGDRRKPPV